MTTALARSQGVQEARTATAELERSFNPAAADTLSPIVYGITPAASAWDFTSVRARGTVEKIGTQEETLEVVRATVWRFEKGFGAGWGMTESLPCFREILPAVGAFGFAVTGAEGMCDSSQEQAPDIRDRVQESSSGRECTRHCATAGLMGGIA